MPRTACFQPVAVMFGILIAALAACVGDLGEGSSADREGMSCPPGAHCVFLPNITTAPRPGCHPESRNLCTYPGSPEYPRPTYCDPDGDGELDDGDWARGYAEYQAKCQTTAPLPRPACDPNALDCDGDRSNGCEAIPDASGGCGNDYRAIVLIDEQLYHVLSGLVDSYLRRATARNNFKIGLHTIHGVDSWSYARVKDYLIRMRDTIYPSLEGVLFIGNIKIPSFYKSRNDITLTRLAPRYYEDLDGVFVKNYPDGSIDPPCPTRSPHCAVFGPLTIPPHDFDSVEKGPIDPYPELWAAFMPVGYATDNTYTRFGEQLTPYLRKVIAYYKHGAAHNDRYYLVANGHGEEFEQMWDSFSPQQIDFYGKPGPQNETGSACVVNGQNLCYVRWPLESFSSYSSFYSAYHSLPWVGEGWQQASIFTDHMNSRLYPAVEVCVHSEYYSSLVSVEQARAIQRAGLIVALDGCGVAGFRQVTAASSLDARYAAPLTSTQVKELSQSESCNAFSFCQAGSSSRPSNAIAASSAPLSGGSYTDVPNTIQDNILGAYLYGASQALAGLGDPFWRGHYASVPTILSEMRSHHAYLGRAHWLRMKRLADQSPDAWSWRENGMEMLLGDPFLKIW
jgi:hypothetical protein